MLPLAAASTNLYLDRHINAFIDTLVASSTHSQTYRHTSIFTNTQIFSVSRPEMYTHKCVRQVVVETIAASPAHVTRHQHNCVA